MSHSAQIRTHKYRYRLSNQIKLNSTLMDLKWLKVLATPVPSHTCWDQVCAKSILYNTLLSAIVSFCILIINRKIHL